MTVARVARLIVLVFVGVGFAPPLCAQLRTGEWTAGLQTASDIEAPFRRLVSIGGHVGLRLAPGVSTRLSLAAFTGRSGGQASTYLRVDPVPSAPSFPLYVGGGARVIRWHARDHVLYELLLAGVEGRIGRYQPYVEVQALDPIRGLLRGGSAPASLQAQVGVSAVWMR